jgi:dihydroorotase
VSLTIIRPDDWHCHLRFGAVLADTVRATAGIFNRAIIMPNLYPPIYTIAEAIKYRSAIQEVCASSEFNPLMTLYFNTGITRSLLQEAVQYPWFKAVKLYPAGVTTNSEHGVKNLKDIFYVCELLQEFKVRLLVHGESNENSVDVFEREAHFIEHYLQPLTQNFPDLKIVLEHITTRQAVSFVKNSSDNIAATITPHHLLYNRNDLLGHGLRPHLYCAPVLKTELDRAALVKAATSGDAKFFLGTDSAPHAISKKESSCGCAGIYNSPVAIEAYAQVFELAGELHNLERFASINGAKFYDMPINTDTITLVQEEWVVPEVMRLGDSEVRPMLAGEKIRWQVVKGRRYV